MYLSCSIYKNKYIFININVSVQSCHTFLYTLQNLTKLYLNLKNNFTRENKLSAAREGAGGGVPQDKEISPKYDELRIKQDKWHSVLRSSIYMTFTVHDFR